MFHPACAVSSILAWNHVFAVGEFLVPTETSSLFHSLSPFPFFVLWELRAEPVRYFSSEPLCIDSLRGGGRLPPTASFLLGSDCQAYRTHRAWVSECVHEWGSNTSVHRYLSWRIYSLNVRLCISYGEDGCVLALESHHQWEVGGNWSRNFSKEGDILRAVYQIGIIFPFLIGEYQVHRIYCLEKRNKILTGSVHLWTKKIEFTRT